MMATYYRTINDPSKPCVKIIRVQDNQVSVNFTNLGDGVLVAWALSMSRVRHQMCTMTQPEIDRVWLEQGAMFAGAGI